MALQDIQTEQVTLTEAGAEAVKEMLAKRELEGYALRVFVSGGGCSGFQYGMALEAETRASDLVFEQHDVKVVVDEVSITYLKGSTIDYVEDVMGSGFKIDNPNVVSSCGCGNSFRTEEGGPEGHTGHGGCNC